MTRKIGWFHPSAGYVFVAKHMMRWLMIQAQWTYLYTTRVVLLCFSLSLCNMDSRASF